MRVRDFAWRALGGTAALLLLTAHSPYRQWAVYRQAHLVIVADEGAPGAFATSDAVARVLAAHVEHSRAIATSARSSVDVVKLLRSRQLPLGLMLAEDAVDALVGHGRFARDGPLALRTLAALGPYLLVSLEDFPAAKAAEIARALAAYAPEGARPPGAAAPAVPLHPGAAALVGVGPVPAGE